MFAILAAHLVDDLELLSLLGHLLEDVWRGEDGLEVLPGRLALEPVVDDVLEPHHQGLGGKAGVEEEEEEEKRRLGEGEGGGGSGWGICKGLRIWMLG